MYEPYYIGIRLDQNNRKETPVVIRIDDDFSWERCAGSTETHKQWNNYCNWKNDHGFTQKDLARLR